MWIGAPAGHGTRAQLVFDFRLLIFLNFFSHFRLSLSSPSLYCLTFIVRHTVSFPTATTTAQRLCMGLVPQNQTFFFTRLQVTGSRILENGRMVKPRFLRELVECWGALVGYSFHRKNDGGGKKKRHTTVFFFMASCCAQHGSGTLPGPVNNIPNTTAGENKINWGISFQDW